MPAVTSKVGICNMALSHMGNYGTVNDIENPKDSKESTFALWYDTTRQAALRLAIPNFAMARRIVAKKSTTPVFGYAYSYEYPSDCVKVLGFGDADANPDSYSVERGIDGFTEIQIDEDYVDGLPLRYIADVEDVAAMTADFKILLSYLLAANTVLPITQKQNLKDKIELQLPSKISQLSGINAQENPPIRKSTSNFRQARYTTPVRHGSKR